MEVVLLERIEKLGQMGDVVKVKAGFARNYLLPQKKALRATPDNMAYFESQKAQLEARNLEQRKDAEAVAKKMDGVSVIIVRQAAETGQLYGSVTSRDVADSLADAGFTVNRNQVVLDIPLKVLGIAQVRIRLHPDVSVMVDVNVARSEEEAARQVTDAAEAAEAIHAEDVFESAEVARQAVEALTEKPEAEEEPSDAKPESAADADGEAENTKE